MWKTVLALIVTILVVPLLAFYLDEPLSFQQKDIMHDLVRVYLLAALACFVVSSFSRNYSQVDKLWSTIPIAYVWMVAFQSGFEDRLVLMAVLVSLWGLRLTFNFSRRGGYSWRFWEGEEDYRWAVLQARPEFQASWRWVLFNLFFISLYQMGLILLFTLPAVRSLEGLPLGWTDYLLTLLFLSILLIETLADQQQWNYHKAKRAARDAGNVEGAEGTEHADGDLPEIYRKGFVHTGLWGRVRHPNYAAEQGIWLVFYFFSVSATGSWLNWSVMGILLLMVLFWSSSNFSESISAGKYPDYPDYRENTPRFIPLRFGQRRK